MTTAKISQTILASAAYTNDNMYPYQITIKIRFASKNLMSMVSSAIKNYLKQLFHYRRMTIEWE